MFRLFVSIQIYLILVANKGSMCIQQLEKRK